MTTDASCFENIHAQAILELQVGFRFGLATYLVNHTKIRLSFRLLTILNRYYVVVLTYMIRVLNLGGGN